MISFFGKRFHFLLRKTKKIVNKFSQASCSGGNNDILRFAWGYRLACHSDTDRFSVVSLNKLIPPLHPHPHGIFVHRLSICYYVINVWCSHVGYTVYPNRPFFPVAYLLQYIMNMITVSIFLFADFVSLTHLLQEERQYTNTGIQEITSNTGRELHKCCLLLHWVIASLSLCS